MNDEIEVIEDELIKDLQNEEVEEEEFEDVTPTDVPVPALRLDGMVDGRRESAMKNMAKARKKLDRHKEKSVKLSWTTKDKLLDIINKNMDDFDTTLDAMKKEDPKAFVAVMVQLQRYVAPTLASVAAEVTASGKITIEHQLAALSKPGARYREVEED